MLQKNLGRKKCCKIKSLEESWMEEEIIGRILEERIMLEVKSLDENHWMKIIGRILDGRRNYWKNFGRKNNVGRKKCQNVNVGRKNNVGSKIIGRKSLEESWKEEESWKIKCWKKEMLECKMLEECWKQNHWMKCWKNVVEEEMLECKMLEDKSLEERNVRM